MGKTAVTADERNMKRTNTDDMLRSSKDTVHYGSFDMMERCPECECSFYQNKRGTKKYCSNACKTSASRKRHPVEPDIDDRLPAQKAIETKESSLTTHTCHNCGQYIIVNGTQGKKRFCNAACKMAYHRRYDWSGRYAPKKPGSNRGEPMIIPVIQDDRDAVYDAWAGLAEGNVIASPEQPLDLVATGEVQ